MIDLRTYTEIFTEAILEDIWAVWSVQKYTEGYYAILYMRPRTYYISCMYNNLPVKILKDSKLLFEKARNFRQKF